LKCRSVKSGGRGAQLLHRVATEPRMLSSDIRLAGTLIEGDSVAPAKR